MKYVTEMTKVESSMVSKVGYIIDDSILIIEFKNGAIFEYRNVPYDVYKFIVSSNSVGGAFHSMIKGKYPFNKSENFCIKGDISPKIKVSNSVWMDYKSKIDRILDETVDPDVDMHDSAIMDRISNVIMDVLFEEVYDKL